MRTQMVRHAREYRWSSYRANAEGRSNSLIQLHDIYNISVLGEAYRGLFKAQMDDRLLVDIRTAPNGNYVLGTTRFQEEIGMTGSQRKINHELRITLLQAVHRANLTCVPKRPLVENSVTGIQRAQRKGAQLFAA